MSRLSAELMKHFGLTEPGCVEHSRKKLNCKGNPNCLQGLTKGNSVWSAEVAGRLQYRSKQRTSASKYIGLQNLGATCYMNSLLQCLYMDESFRRAIFSWRPSSSASSQSSSSDSSSLSSPSPEGSSIQEGERVLEELQLLFALLQRGNMAYISPQSLTDLLNIKTSIQQDATEFNSLFLSYVEKQFAQSSNAALRSFIARRYCGTYTYLTRCCRCQRTSQCDTQFNELQLTIKGMKTLDTALRKLLDEETLDGHNQYRCNECKSLQDASRWLEIRHLPPVLNVQLLRFVYDRKLMSKQKITSRIEVPLYLDMAAYTSSSLSSSSSHSSSSHRYSLKAMLIHLGPSAHQGHYIAYVRELATNQWWKFDDCTTTPVTLEQLGERRRDSKAKPLPPDVVSTTNAYMLVYTADDGGEPNNEERELNAEPPAELIDEVCRRNEDNAAREQEARAQAELLRARVAEHQAFYERFIGEATITDRNFSEADAAWISRAWLEEWARGMWIFEQGAPPLPSVEAELCHHKRLDPRCIEGMKRLQRSSFKALLRAYAIEPELVQLVGLCPTCAEQQKQTDRREDADAATKHRMLTLIAHKTPDMPAEQQVWIPKAWLAEWRKRSPRGELLGEAISETITCPHGQLHPDETQRRLIPREAWDYIALTFPSGALFDGAAVSCAQCASSARQMTATLQQRKQQRSKERRALQTLYKLVVGGHVLDAVPEGVGSYCWLPLTWLDSWAHYLDNVVDVEALEPLSTAALLCPHDGLLFDPAAAADYLQSPPLAVIPEEFFDQLAAMHGFDGPRKIKSYRSRTCVDTDTPPCPDCSAEQRQRTLAAALNFDAGSVRIEPHTDGEGRRARRTRARIKSGTIPCSAATTVRELAILVYQYLDVPPNLQQLSYAGERLPLNDLPLSHYAVRSGATIHLAIANDDDDAGYLELFDGARSGSESGFTGSGLVGASFAPQPATLDHQHASSSSSSSGGRRGQKAGAAKTSHRRPLGIDVAADDESDDFATDSLHFEGASSRQQGWTCAECSFDNSPFLYSCEMCESQRRAQK